MLPGKRQLHQKTLPIAREAEALGVHKKEVERLDRETCVMPLMLNGRAESKLSGAVALLPALPAVLIRRAQNCGILSKSGGPRWHLIVK